MTQAIAAKNSMPDATVGRMPDFLIIGAAKAGTTTLWHYLDQHPDVFMAHPKEPGYFAERYDRGEAWYRALFAGAADHQVCGEASTHYSVEAPDDALDTVVDRIARDLRGARLIYLVRHPVERAYSFYLEQIKTRQIKGRQIGYERTFEQYLHDDPRCFLGGCYMAVIHRYLARFPRAALLVLTLEDLQKDPQGTIDRVCAHIGVASIKVDREAPIAANRSSNWRQTIVRRQVLQPLRRLPLLGPLGARLPDPVRNGIYACLSRSAAARIARRRVVPPPMRDETRRRLLEQYREQTSRLEQWLGRDLSHWLK